MKWFQIRVMDAAIAEGRLKVISDAFERAMPPGEDAKGCALFLTMETDWSTVFILPQFAAVAPQLLTTFSAVPGGPPPPRRKGEEFGTSLLLASHDKFAWSL